MYMEKIYNEIIAFLQDYQEKSSCKGYVINISGGKDSTVVGKLLVDSIGPQNVIGVIQPNGVQEDLNDAIEVCKLLNIKYIICNIENTFNSILTIIEQNNFKVTEKAKTNISPRIRMLNAYAIAQTLGYRVAGTGNKSEAFIGWFTKWGDGGCDIDPIAHLTCTEVIELGDYLGLPYDLVHKTPADGLTGKSDEENLGFTYAEIDRLIYKHDFLISTGYVIEPFTDREKEILKMHDRAYHKTSVIKLA